MDRQVCPRGGQLLEKQRNRNRVGEFQYPDRVESQPVVQRHDQAEREPRLLDQLVDHPPELDRSPSDHPTNPEFRQPQSPVQVGQRRVRLDPEPERDRWERVADRAVAVDFAQADRYRLERDLVARSQFQSGCEFSAAAAVGPGAAGPGRASRHAESDRREPGQPVHDEYAASDRRVPVAELGQPDRRRLRRPPGGIGQASERGYARPDRLDLGSAGSGRRIRQ